jgi:citrate synthase
VIFGVARTAGWIAHAVEEYREQPLRWRGRELYTGAEPPAPETAADSR